MIMKCEHAHYRKCTGRYKAAVGGGLPLLVLFIAMTKGMTQFVYKACLYCLLFRVIISAFKDDTSCYL